MNGASYFYLIKGLQELGYEPILIGPGDSEVNYKNMTLDYLRAHNTVIQNFKERASEL